MSSLTTTDRLKNLLPQLFSEQQRRGDYYLRFQLTDRISGLIDLKYVQESLTVDGDRITAVPNLPEYVVGLMSSRNQVFLAVDLAHLTGFPPETVNLRQYQTIVVQINSEQNNIASDRASLFGLTVKSIQGISRIMPEQFSADISAMPDPLSPFVKSYVMQASKESERLSTASERSFLIDISTLITTKISTQK